LYWDYDVLLADQINDNVGCWWGGMVVSMMEKILPSFEVRGLQTVLCVGYYHQAKWPTPTQNFFPWSPAFPWSPRLSDLGEDSTWSFFTASGKNKVKVVRTMISAYFDSANYDTSGLLCQEYSTKAVL